MKKAVKRGLALIVNRITLFGVGDDSDGPSLTSLYILVQLSTLPFQFFILAKLVILNSIIK